MAQGAVVAVHIAPLAVKDHHRSRHLRLRLIPVQRHIHGQLPGAMRSGQLYQMVGDDLHWLLVLSSG